MSNHGTYFALLTAIVTLLPIGAETAGLAYNGQTPTDALSSSYPGEGSLYYGQYSQSFPLYTIGTGGGPEVTLTLDYNSNVHNVVTVTNRDAQASWVGLGFELGGEAVSANHHYTVDISDDEYYFVGHGGSTKLFRGVGMNEYFAADGRLWSFERHVAFDGTRNLAVGWTVKKDDGTIYRFGDFILPPSSVDDRNATRYQLAWGATIGVGTGHATHIYPYHWDLQRIEDITGNHWLEYSYQRNENNMRDVSTYNVINGTPMGTMTDNDYETATLPRSIASNLGDSILFDVIERDDVEFYYPKTYQEFQNSYRLDRLRLLDRSGNLVSQIRFYCTKWHAAHPLMGDQHAKSLLDSVVVLDATGTKRLPSTKFQYYTGSSDPLRGGLKQIESPGGGVHRISYRELESDKIYSTLDYLDDSDTRSYSARIFSRDVYIGKWQDETGVRHFEVGSWNGYWDFEDIDDVTDQYEGRDILSDAAIDVAAGEGWVVLYEHDAHHFIVMEYRQGIWKRDTINIGWPQSDDALVEIHVGDRFFVATERQRHEVWLFGMLMEIHLRSLKNAFYYGRTDEGWTENVIYQAGEWVPHFGDLQISNGVFALGLSDPNPDNNNHNLIFGAYDYDTDQLLTEIAFSSYQPGILWAVGINSVAWTQWNSATVHIADYDPLVPAGWVITDRQVSPSSNDARSITAMKSGFIVTFQLGDHIYSKDFFMRGSGGQWQYFYVSNWYDDPQPMSSAGGDAFTYIYSPSAGSSRDTRIAWLQGSGWWWETLLSDQGSHGVIVKNSDELAIMFNHYNNALYACQRNSFATGDFTWTNAGDPAYLATIPCPDDDVNIDGARDLVSLVRYSDSDDAFIWQWEDDEWVQYDITSMVPSRIIHSGCSTNLFHKSGECRLQSVYSDRAFYSGGVDGRAAMQVFNNQYTGKPTVAVLDKVEILEHANDPNPIVQTYDYDYGIMDVAVSSGRFGKVIVSTPYYANESPDGYTIHKFYNDMDDSDYPSLEVPDLQDAQKFGLAEGGYLLDGAVYESYDSSATDGPGTAFDYRKYDYQLYQFSDHWTDIYRSKMVRTERRVDDVVKEVAYHHDDSGRLILTETSLGNGVVKYDSVEYAEFSADLNILTQPAVEMSWLDSSGTIQHLSRQAYSWFPDGTGVEYQAVWPDASSENLADARFGFKTILDYPNQGRDEHNNLIAWTSGHSDTLSAKYGPNGRFRVASIIGAVPEEYLLFDGEHGYVFDAENHGYDEWYNTMGLGSISSQEKFTGGYSYFIPGTASGSLQGEIEFYVDRSSHIYLFSAWVKTSGTAIVETEVYGGGAGYSWQMWTFPGTGEWQKIEFPIDFDTQGVDPLNNCYVTISKTGGDTYFDDIRLCPIDISVFTYVYDVSSGNLLSSAGQSNLPVFAEYDSFHRPNRTFDHKGRTISESALAFSRDSTGDGSYDPNTPNFVKSTKYRDGEAIVSLSYSDGLGRALQTRSTVEFDGTLQTLVSGSVERDARGKVLKGYKPYIDLVGSVGLGDYTTPTNVAGEANAFYDGTHGVNCNGIPYLETEYSPDFKARPEKSGRPGQDFSLSSTHYALYDQYTWINGSDTLLVSTTTDPDGVVTAIKSDPHGRFTARVSHYHRDAQTTDSLQTITYNDIMEQQSRTAIDTGGAEPTPEIPLRKSWGNDLGQVDSTWKVDYGKVRMVRGTKGRLRFMQNDLRRSEDRFVYYKYDASGRMIEEGVYPYPDEQYFSRTYADNPDFPSAGDDPDVKYRWYYDQYYFYDAVADTGYTIVSPGSLVRVENSDCSYYKQFYAFPAEDYDLTIIQLPNGGSLKGIRRDYNEDGSLKKHTVYPDWPNVTAGTTVMEYTYDDGGRTKSITDAAQTTFAEYAYEANGSMKQLKYGMDLSGNNPIQVIDYDYDSRGMLTSINDPDNVSTSLEGTADHFGYEIDYTGDGAGYYNGRVHSIRSVNSSVSGSQDHRFQYEYHDLGWLEDADHIGDATLDRQYGYNCLGNRVLYCGGYGSPCELEYDTTEGSSRLILDHYYQNPMEIQYDILGNMTSDATRELSNLDYEYRNLLSAVFFWTFVTHGEAGPMPGPRLEFMYDENGQRLEKLYIDHHLDSTCLEDMPRGSQMGGMIIMGGTLPPPDTIIDPPIGLDWDFFWVPDTNFTFYLLDGSAVAATFDESDQRLEGFVNGPSGRIASFSGPDNTYPYYFLNDHLGSARVIMSDGLGGSRSVAQCLNYLPFGKVFEQWGSLQSSFQYASKELDGEYGFDHNYFGARYYDPRRGRFTSIDKAGQFASGYIYGGNNPISMVDQDGNWVWAALQLAGHIYARYQMVQAAINDDGVGFMLAGAGILGVPTGIPNLYQGAHLGYSVATSALTAAANRALWNYGLGQKWNRGLAQSAGMGAYSGFVGSQHFRNWDATGEFRSFESSARRYGLIASPQYASLGATPMTTYEFDARDRKGWLRGMDKMGYIDFDVDYSDRSVTSTTTLRSITWHSANILQHKKGFSITDDRQGEPGRVGIEFTADMTTFESVNEIFYVTPLSDEMAFLRQKEFGSFYTTQLTTVERATAYGSVPLPGMASLTETGMTLGLGGSNCLPAVVAMSFMHTPINNQLLRNPSLTLEQAIIMSNMDAY